MVKSRPLTVADLPEVQALHDKFFGNDFTLPDLTRMLCGFVVTDENDKTILAGGVRPIGEVILVTDKEHPSKTELGRALVEAQMISKFVCRDANIDWLHAFVKDEQYARHLIKHGFNPRCLALSMKV